MFDLERLIAEHELLTRRYFLRMGVAGAALARLWPDSARSDPRGPELAEATAKLDPYFTPLDEFRAATLCRTSCPRTFTSRGRRLTSGPEYH